MPPTVRHTAIFAVKFIRSVLSLRFDGVALEGVRRHIYEDVERDHMYSPQYCLCTLTRAKTAELRLLVAKARSFLIYNTVRDL